QRHAIHAGHLVVGEHEVEILLARQLQRVLGALRGGHLIAVVSEDEGVDFPLVAFVVNDQHFVSWHSLFSLVLPTAGQFSSAAGSVTVKVVPRSIWLSTAILPRCSSMILR